MAKLYATLILNGLKTYAEVPASQKEKVKEILIEKGREDLVIE